MKLKTKIAISLIALAGMVILLIGINLPSSTPSIFLITLGSSIIVSGALAAFLSISLLNYLESTYLHLREKSQLGIESFFNSPEALYSQIPLSKRLSQAKSEIIFLGHTLKRTLMALDLKKVESYLENNPKLTIKILIRSTDDLPQSHNSTVNAKLRFNPDDLYSTHKLLREQLSNMPENIKSRFIIKTFNFPNTLSIIVIDNQIIVRLLGYIQKSSCSPILVVNKLGSYGEYFMEYIHNINQSSENFQ